MAKMTARRDVATKYAYIASADNYPLPTDARDLLKRNLADYSGTTQEWRVHLDRAAAVVASLRISGHEVIAIETGEPTAPKSRIVGPLECSQCGCGYKRDAVSEGRACVECASDLVLVPPPGSDQ